MTAFAFEPSGALKAPTPEALAGADHDTAILAYTHGAMPDGRPYYAYVAVKPGKYRAFHAATAARRPMVIADYGEVVMGGFEAAPPPEVVAQMRDEYGFDEEFEEKLKLEVLQQQEAFLNGREAQRVQDIVAMLRRKNGSTDPA